VPAPDASVLEDPAADETAGALAARRAMIGPLAGAGAVTLSFL